jgi:uncharacterized membrane protein required for colicin V production
MFANAIQSLTSDNLPVNWFDVVVVLILGFGLFRGRKNGMSKEILPLFQWLAVILVSGLFYAMVAQSIAQMVKLDPLIGNLLAYAILAAVVFLFCSLIKRTVGLKLFGSNLFGNAEYYLGMPSGLVRYACMLIFALAFLNARHYTTAQPTTQPSNASAPPATSWTIIGGVSAAEKGRGELHALCPFHKEKTPSFNVNPHRQIFHCFGCHKGGDVFTFVKEYENIGFVDAVRRLAERAKIPLEFDQNPAEQQSRHLKDQLLQIHEQIAQRWQNCLLNEAAGQMARDYLAKRGVSADAVKLFRLGAAPDLWDDTVNWAKSKEFRPAAGRKGRADSSQGRKTEIITTAFAGG